MIKSASKTVNENLIEIDFLLKNGGSIVAMFEYKITRIKVSQTWEEEEYNGRQFIELYTLENCVECTAYDDEGNDSKLENYDSELEKLFKSRYRFDDDLDLSNWVE